MEAARRLSNVAFLVALSSAGPVPGLLFRPAVLAWSPSGCSASSDAAVTITSSRSGACLPVPFSATFAPSSTASAYRLQCGLASSPNGARVIGTGVLQLCDEGCSVCSSTTAVTNGDCKKPDMGVLATGIPGVTVTCTADSSAPSLGPAFAGPTAAGVGVTSWYPTPTCGNASAVVIGPGDGSCMRAPVPSNRALFYAATCSASAEPTLRLCSDNACAACSAAILARGCASPTAGAGDGYAAVSLMCGAGGAAGGGRLPDGREGLKRTGKGLVAEDVDPGLVSIPDGQSLSPEGAMPTRSSGDPERLGASGTGPVHAGWNTVVACAIAATALMMASV